MGSGVVSTKRWAIRRVFEGSVGYTLKARRVYYDTNATWSISNSLRAKSISCYVLTPWSI